MINRIIEGFGGKSSKTEYTAPRPAYIISSQYAINNYGYNPMTMDQIISRFVQENQ